MGWEPEAWPRLSPCPSALASRAYDGLGGECLTGSKVKLLAGVQGISGLRTKHSEDAGHGDRLGAGWGGAGPSFPWKMKGGPSGRRLLRVSM